MKIIRVVQSCTLLGSFCIFGAKIAKMETRLRRKWGTLFHIFADSSLGEEFEELELAKSAKAEHGVLGGRNLLDLSFCRPSLRAAGTITSFLCLNHTLKLEIKWARRDKEIYRVMNHLFLPPSPTSEFIVQ